MNTGLPDGTSVLSLAISGGYVFAGTDTTGIWKRALSEMEGVNELRSENGDLRVYTNPANSLLVVSYSLLEKNQVKISLYDITGREVGLISNEVKDKGDYKIEFDSEKLNNGIYFCKMQAGNMSMTKKIVVMH